MAATVGVNSYISVADATAYFAARYGYSLWAAEANKDAALVSAAQILDNYCDWFGKVTNSAQTLAFPRDYTDDVVPQPVIDAQCEIAYLIVSTGSVNQKADDPLEELKAGSVSLKFAASKSGNPLTNRLVDALVSLYGICGGSGTTKLIPIARC